MLVFVSGQIGATLMSYGTNQIGIYIIIINTLLLAVFIYATAPASGGHVNPMITFSTLLTGLCPLPRGELPFVLDVPQVCRQPGLVPYMYNPTAIIYLCAQTLGAAIGGGLLIGVLGSERGIRLKGTGCFFDSSEIKPSQVFLNEAASCFAMLYLAFGVGLDPRQALLFGPKFGPLLVAASLAVLSFASSSMVPGYTGASMNPARCFGLGILRGDLSGQFPSLSLSFPLFVPLVRCFFMIESCMNVIANAARPYRPVDLVVRPHSRGSRVVFHVQCGTAASF